MDALPPALQAPVDCGRRLLPAVLDEVAITDPERVFVSVPRNPENVSAGFQDITYATFAQAVNKCAWWLRDRVGMPTDPQTILYIGPLDIRYILIIIAAAKAGHTVSARQPPGPSILRLTAHSQLLGFLQLSP